MIKRNVYLLLFIFIASFTLITIDHYTIKVLSAVRSYINGESEYSKGQKDALLYLYTYIQTEDSAYITSFKRSLNIPAGDNLARHSLLNNSDDSLTTRYFLMGKNNPEDIPEMIWLFKTFSSSYMREPIRLWSDAEPLINQLGLIGDQISTKINNKTLTDSEKVLAVKQISAISAELYKKESKFSEVLGNTAREINSYLFYANILCILMIIGNIAYYVIRAVQKLSLSNNKLEKINKEIKETNKELDFLVYSISHDLRSPITSVKGLLNIIREEDDIDKVKEYASLIDNTINKQDIFIIEIIDFFKNKRSSLSYHEFSLKKLIEDVLDNNKFTPQARHITLTKDINLDIVCTDELRVKMIVNNLISNAIKYSDENKEVRTLYIKTQKQQNEIMIEIADNGIGIDKKHIGKIYNMFFVTPNMNKGTGLGLYILKQNLEKLKGRVDVQSELHVGTKFTVHIPLLNK